MRKIAICIKEESSVYGFKKDEIHEYIEENDQYFVEKKAYYSNRFYYCGFDEKKFNDHFIDLQQIRKKKLKKLSSL